MAWPEDLNTVLHTQPAPWWMKLGGWGLIGLLALRSFLSSGKQR
jgi:hypothetical protein